MWQRDPRTKERAGFLETAGRIIGDPEAGKDAKRNWLLENQDTIRELIDETEETTLGYLLLARGLWKKEEPDDAGFRKEWAEREGKYYQSMSTVLEAMRIVAPETVEGVSLALPFDADTFADATVSFPALRQ